MSINFAKNSEQLKRIRKGGTKVHTTPYAPYYTLHTTPYTLHPTLHTTPYTLRPTPYTLHTTLYTLHTTHYTLHTTHYTLHTTLHTHSEQLKKIRKGGAKVAPFPKVIFSKSHLLIKSSSSSAFRKGFFLSTMRCLHLPIKSSFSKVNFR